MYSKQIKNFDMMKQHPQLFGIFKEMFAFVFAGLSFCFASESIYFRKADKISFQIMFLSIFPAILKRFN